MKKMEEKKGAEGVVDGGNSVPDGVSRREFLKRTCLSVAIGGVSGLVLGKVLFATGIVEDKDDSDVSGSSNESGVEFAEVKPVPEDERSGKNIMLTSFDGLDFLRRPFDGWIKSFLEALPDSTNVLLLSSVDMDKKYFETIANKHENVVINVVGIEASTMCVMENMLYVQDVFFPSGKIDKNGRFVLFTSAADFGIMKISQDSKGAYSGGGIDPCEALRFVGDDLVVKRYPNYFAGIEAPVSLVGGDVQIIRLPDGRIACLVGKDNLSKTALYIKGANSLYSNDGGSLDLTKEALMNIKNMYREALRVDECIFLDEENIFANAPLMDYGKLALFSSFFHSDMIVKTASSPKDPSEHLAFVTDVKPLSGDESTEAFVWDSEYLDRVEKQFKDLGYRIVSLPCGPYAALNYTNSVMFTRDGKKYVLLPQYGIHTDNQASDIFENEGFEVRRVDMSFILEWMSAVKNAGSLHCMTVVMN